MSGERRAIEHPLVVDFSGHFVPPLRFLLQQDYSPLGVIERPSPGITTSHTPWYTEVVLELTGIDAVAVLYLMHEDDECILLMACLEQSVEPFFKHLSGADFGDGLTSLVSRRWPDLYAMLLHSNTRDTRARILCKMATPGQVQWVVADQLRGAEREYIDNERVLDLISTALETYLRVSRYLVELPGVFEVIGGPDRTTRGLNAIGGLLTAAGNIGQTFEDGVLADELVQLASDARDFVKSLLELRE